MVGPQTIFKIEALKRLENAMLNMVFTNNRAILLFFLAEFTEGMLDIFLYPKSRMGPPWLVPKKIYQNKGSQRVQKRYFQIGFCKYSISQESHSANL